MDLQRITKSVIGLCEDTAAFIRKEAEDFDLSRIEQKTKFNNLVSYVDKEAEQKLVAGLRQIVPEAAFITEEGTVEQTESAELHWIIDPLDGTTNYLHGFPVYAISVALTRKHKPIVGVIYHVVQKEAFYAWEGDVSYCNGKPIHVSAVPTISEALLATGFPYHQSPKADAYLDIIKELLDKTHGIRRLGSAAIDLAYVACGRMEGFFEYNLNPWDVAAGVLIVERAGGKVSDFSGGDNILFGKELCASNGKLQADMLAIIDKHWN